jgi:hypothetical protein
LNNARTGAYRDTPGQLRYLERRKDQSNREMTDHTTH